MADCRCGARGIDIEYHEPYCVVMLKERVELLEMECNELNGQLSACAAKVQELRKGAAVKDKSRAFDPVHNWFELTYAQYVALPRTILQSMPGDWQERFVELMEELDAHFEWRRDGCWVKFKNSNGRFIEDELADYQRGRRVLTQEQVKDLTERHNKRYRNTETQKAEGQ